MLLGQPLPHRADLCSYAYERDGTNMSGMTMHGKATDPGSGNYAIRTNFSMAGRWKLTVEVRKELLDLKQDIDLVIN